MLTTAIIFVSASTVVALATKREELIFKFKLCPSLFMIGMLIAAIFWGVMFYFQWYLAIIIMGVISVATETIKVILNKQ